MEPTKYRIMVRGRLTERLGSAFEGLDLEPGMEQTALVGEIRDQSHLYGVLDLVRGLGLELVSVETNWVTSEPGDQTGEPQRDRAEHAARRVPARVRRPDQGNG